MNLFNFFGMLTLLAIFIFNLSSNKSYASPLYAFPPDIFDYKEGALIPITDSDYLGITLDALLLPLKDQHYIFESKKFINLARNLGPSYFRMGGTAADDVNFVSKINNSSNNLSGGITLTPELWDKLNNFVKSVGSWKFIFGLNALIRKDGKWDPSNAIDLLKYSKLKGYKFHLELGNEPGEFVQSFGKYVEPEQLAEDFRVLKQIIRDNSSKILIPNNLNSPFYPDSWILGPDLDRINDTDQPYLKRFLSKLGSFGPEGKNVIDRVTWHHYYVNGPKAQPNQFVDPNILDSLIPKIQSVAKTVRDSPLSKLKIWLGEGSSAYNSGAPNISDRYIAGFMFLDKLGLCALNNVQAFIRQAFYYGHYAMIGMDLEPNPDYWTAVLYKRLVGPQVLPLSTSGITLVESENGILGRDLLDSFNEVSRNAPDHNQDRALPIEILQVPKDVRIYGHCARAGADVTTPYLNYTRGSVVFYVLNLKDIGIQIGFAPRSPLGSVLHSFTLTAPGGKNPNDVGLDRLLTRSIALNGKILRTDRDGHLPPLKPVVQQQINDRNVLVIDTPAYSYGFYVFPQARVPECMWYHL